MDKIPHIIEPVYYMQWSTTWLAITREKCNHRHLKCMWFLPSDDEERPLDYGDIILDVNPLKAIQLEFNPRSIRLSTCHSLQNVYIHIKTLSLTLSSCVHCKVHFKVPLLLATAMGNDMMVMLLLKREDIEVNTKDQYGWTPLFWAVKGGHEAVVKILLARQDVEVNLEDKDSQTPLLEAARMEHDTVVWLLLAREDIEVNKKDEYGHYQKQREWGMAQWWGYSLRGEILT